MREFYSGVCGCEAPVDGGAASIASGLPGGDFATQQLDPFDATVQALAI
jgi:hypothetical protein